jgi:uncharacterized protein involved in tolerance to divalent cations
MQSVAANFKPVEAVGANLHSYKTPVLHALPIAIISEQTKAWITIAI